MSQDKFTRLARNQPCTVRLPGCSGGGEDTVFAHYRSVRLGAGMGKKPPSVYGCFACHSCHETIDSRKFIHDHSRDRVRLAHLEACLETLGRFIECGAIKL